MASTSTRLKALPAGSVTVDRATGTIRGVAVASVGPAAGHGFHLDHKTLSQLAAEIHKQGSVPSRITHPTGDGVLHLIGQLTNPRIDGDTLRGDLEIGEFAEDSPHGNLRAYLLGLAESQPQHFGLSVVVDWQPEVIQDRTFMRITGLFAVDVVDQPAANRRGLLATKQLKEIAMIYDLKILVDEFGMNPDLTEEQIAQFVGLLSPENQSRVTTTAPASDTAAPAEMAAANGANLVALERKRVSDIKMLGAVFPLMDKEVVAEQIANGANVEQARAAFRAYLAEKCKPIAAIRVDDNRRRAELGNAITDAVALSVGARLSKPHELAKQFAGMGTLEVGRRYMESLGANTAGLTRATLAKCLLNPRAAAGQFGSRYAELAASTGDFTHILSTSYNKVLRAGYEETPATWSLWAKRGSAPDFTEAKRPLLSEVPTPAVVLEGAEYTYANPRNTNEVFTLAKYGHIFAITYEALVNDDLSAFTSVVQKFGAAAKRLEDDLAYAPLTSNQTMTEDNTALFHANHNNLTGTGTALSVASLGVGRALMAKQTGPGGATLNIQARHLLVPVEIQTTAEQLVASLVDPSKNNDATNPAFIRGLQVVGEPRLSASSAISWYLAAGSGDTVEVAFLEGSEAPFIEQQESFDTDTTRFKLRHVVAARALDYRGLYKNNGA